MRKNATNNATLQSTGICSPPDGAFLVRTRFVPAATLEMSFLEAVIPASDPSPSSRSSFDRPRESTRPIEGEVFVAEDDPDDLILFQEAISDAFPGLMVRHFSNGEELLDSLSSHRINVPPLLVLDLNMPVKDGRESLKEIRMRRRLDRMTVVVLTTSESPEDREFVSAFPRSHFRTKPVGYADYVRSVVEFVRKAFSEMPE